jgi:glucose dehydrogenase
VRRASVTVVALLSAAAPAAAQNWLSFRGPEATGVAPAAAKPPASWISTSHDEYPSWATPTVARRQGRTEIVTNGGKYIRGLDARTGRELWRLSDNQTQVKVPTPIVVGDLAIVMATPAISGNMLIVRTQTQLVGLGS